MSSVLFRTCDADAKESQAGFDLLNLNELVDCAELDSLFDQMDLDLDHLNWFLAVFLDQNDLEGLGVSQWNFAIAYYGMINSMFDYAMDKFEIEQFDVVSRNRLVHNDQFQYFLDNIFSNQLKQVLIRYNTVDGDITVYASENDGKDIKSED